MTRLEFEIRRATSKDAPAIAAVLYESFAEFRQLYTDGGFAATALSAEQVVTRMQEGPTWVAVCDREAFGTVSAVVKDGSVYVRGMAVLPKTRGSGAGAALLRQVEQWAGETGYRRIFLSTTPFLDSAIRLYERFGFRRTEDGAHDLFGTPLLTMEKITPPDR
jgi:GNAT superfamily N-acetyltransferase